MAIPRKVSTLVRVGRFDGSLEEAVKKSRESMKPISFGLGNTIKYGASKIGNDPYLMMVSQQIDRIPNSFGYNIILSVTSGSDRRNLELTDQFESDTGIRLNLGVPKILLNTFAAIDVQFFETFSRDLGI